MTWLATRSLAGIGLLVGVATGATVAVAVLLAVAGLGEVTAGSAAAVLVSAVAVGALCGRLGVLGLERDQRRLAWHASPRRDGELAGEPLHAEAVAVARAIDGLAARAAASDADRADAAGQLGAVVDGLREGVIVVDAGLATVSMNRAAAEILDIPRSAAVGQSLMVATRDADIVRVVREALEGRPVPALPIDYRRSGRLLTVQVQLASGRGRTLGVVVLQDVTEVRRLESVRRDFVANVSHELRTPLASIRALAETLESGAMHDPEVGPDFLRRIVTEVDRMTDLVEGLIDLGRLQAGRMTLRREPTDLGEIVAGAVARLRGPVEEAGLTVEVEVDADLPPVEVDRVRIDQVLTNLIENAVKFTPRGGRITVRGRCEGGCVAVTVADTGVGIAPDDLDRVFERFYKADQSRHSAGTGLGLAISKHIVLAHGGRIGVTSELGKGATFRVELPTT